MVAKRLQTETRDAMFKEGATFAEKGHFQRWRDHAGVAGPGYFPFAAPFVQPDTSNFQGAWNTPNGLMPVAKDVDDSVVRAIRAVGALERQPDVQPEPPRAVGRPERAQRGDRMQWFHERPDRVQRHLRKQHNASDPDYRARAECGEQFRRSGPECERNDEHHRHQGWLGLPGSRQPGRDLRIPTSRAPPCRGAPRQVEVVLTTAGPGGRLEAQMPPQDGRREQSPPLTTTAIVEAATGWSTTTGIGSRMYSVAPAATTALPKASAPGQLEDWPSRRASGLSARPSAQRTANGSTGRHILVLLLSGLARSNNNTPPDRAACAQPDSLEGRNVWTSRAAHTPVNQGFKSLPPRERAF